MNPPGEFDCGALEPEVLCGVHELLETWDGKHELTEEVNMKLLEARGGDPANNCFQVSVNTPELEPVKVRKCDGCNDRRERKLPRHITVGHREHKKDHERLQLGHK